MPDGDVVTAPRRGSAAIVPSAMRFLLDHRARRPTQTVPTPILTDSPAVNTGRQGVTPLAALRPYLAGISARTPKADTVWKATAVLATIVAWDARSRAGNRKNRRTL